MGGSDITEILERYYRVKGEHVDYVIKAIRELYGKAVKTIGKNQIRIMHVCGTHEHTVTAYGLRSLVPEGLNLIAGPGCPVCVTPGKAIDDISKLAIEGAVIVYTYGDVYKLPGIKLSLAKAKSLGGDVRVVYSFLDALKDAKKHSRESIFVGVGFETTAPSVASPLLKGRVPKNLKIASLYRLTAPGLNEALKAHVKSKTPIDGVIPPGHVSTIIGAKAWSYLSEVYKIPAVVAGFEPLDYLIALAEILKQLCLNESKLVNEYSRVARWEGNVNAWNTVMKVFNVVDAYWRGIGVLKDSGLELKDEYLVYDACKEYGISTRPSQDMPRGCKCAEITLGLAVPTDCPHFMRGCLPDKPIGPCMVSIEGTCSVWARFGGGGLADEIAKELGLKP